LLSNALAGELERGAGSGRALEEAVDDRAAAQGVALLLGLPVELDIAVGEVEELVDVVGRQALDPEQMPVREGGLGGASLHQPGTIGGSLSTRNNDCSVDRTGVSQHRRLIGFCPRPKTVRSASRAPAKAAWRRPRRW